jgi:hypothetical protein
MPFKTRTVNSPNLGRALTLRGFAAAIAVLSENSSGLDLLFWRSNFHLKPVTQKVLVRFMGISLIGCSGMDTGTNIGAWCVLDRLQ